MSFAQTFMYFASPTLCGIKPANLFSVSAEDFKSGKSQLKTWEREFSHEGHACAVIRRGTVLLLFVYNKPLLEKTLSAPSARYYLAQKGYPLGYPKSTQLNAFLHELFVRLSRTPHFPNEIGLFLGYPLEDVIAFEKDAGKGSKYTGIWQVYGNVEEACKTMRLYKQCSNTCCRLLGHSQNVTSVCRLYRARLEGFIEKRAS